MATTPGLESQAMPVGLADGSEDSRRRSGERRARGAPSEPAPTDAELLTALERLFTIGVLYPAGHTQCVDVATVFRQKMQRLLGGAPVLSIEADRDILAIQGRTVPDAVHGNTRLHPIMAALGITRLSIDADASPADLYTAVRRLLKMQHEARTIRGFRRVEVEGLPATVRLTLRRFNQRAEGVGDPSSVEEAIETQDKAALELRGFSEETREAVDDLVHRISLQIMSQAIADQPTSDVDVTGAPAARPAVPPASPLERDKGEPRPDMDPAGVAEGCTLPLPELLARLAASAAGEPPRVSLTDRPEQIGVLAQILIRGASPLVLFGIDDLLGHGLVDPSHERMRGVLKGALRDLLGTASPGFMDDALPHLLVPLRRAGALGPLLLEACLSAPESARGAGWPHVTNELLLGLPGVEGPGFLELARLAAGIPEEEMRRALPRLEALEAIRDRRLSRRLFQTPAPELSGLFTVLLGSQIGDQAGVWLREALRARSPAWPMDVALDLMGDNAPRYRGFLTRLLNEGAGGGASPELLAAAVEIIGRGLRSLPRSRRREPLAQRAVQALGLAPTAAAADLLATIQRERRLVVLHAWPRPCRAAAAAIARPAGGATASGKPAGRR